MNSFLDVTNPRVIDLKTRSVSPGASCRGIRRTTSSTASLQLLMTHIHVQYCTRLGLVRESYFPDITSCHVVFVMYKCSWHNIRARCNISVFVAMYSTCFVLATYVCTWLLPFCIGNICMYVAPSVMYWKHMYVLGALCFVLATYVYT